MAGEAILALSAFQAGIESVRGTAVAATRKQGLNGWFVANDDLADVVEQRNSFIEIYRQLKVKRWVELRGLTDTPTFEDLPWYLNQIAGAETLTTVDTTAKKRVFGPAASTDDLKTVTWEALNGVQDFQFPYSLCDKLSLEFFADRAPVMTVDYLAQQAVEATRTGSLSDRDTEDINGALGTAFIDSTTIGSTQVTNVDRAKITLSANWVQLFTFNGHLFSDRAYRKVRHMDLELDIVFDGKAEYDAFIAATDRKIRYRVDGSVCGATTTTKRFDANFYGKWAAFPISDQGGVYKAKAVARSKWDSGASADWGLEVTNGLATLP